MVADSKRKGKAKSASQKRATKSKAAKKAPAKRKAAPARKKGTRKKARAGPPVKKRPAKKRAQKKTASTGSAVGDVVRAIAAAVPALDDHDIRAVLESPPDPRFGDFAFPCFKLAPVLKKGPPQIAQELAGKVKASGQIARVVPAGAYLNFFIEKSALLESAISPVLVQKTRFGASKEGAGKRVMIEYVSPNANKPLHIGHLRNASLGWSLVQLYENAGQKVVKANLYNDRGAGVAKTMLAFQKWGMEDLAHPPKKGDHVVGDYYVRFGKEAAARTKLEEEALALLSRQERGDKDAVALWKKVMRIYHKGVDETLARFGVSFDKVYYENDIYSEGKEIVLDAYERGLLERDEKGALYADLGGELGEKYLLRADGTSVYIVQDIYLASLKQKDYKLDESIVLTGNEQILHFKQLHELLRVLGVPSAKRNTHVPYGMVSLPGGRIKSREGTVADADDLMDQVEDLARLELYKRYPDMAKKTLDKRAKAIMLGALKFFLLRTEAQKDFVFKPEESISFEGQTGPYVMYTYARAKSILRKVKTPSGKVDYALLSHEKERQLATILGEFPRACAQALANHSPHTVCHYLLSLCEAFNSYYHEVPVQRADAKTRHARLALVRATAQVIANGLDLLGISPLEEM